VDVYEDRTWGWHLAHGQALTGRGPDAWLMVLQVAVTFLEPYEIYRSGGDSANRSQEFFCRALRRIFTGSEPALPPGVLDDVAKDIYSEVRCGFAHVGFPRARVALVSDGPSLQVVLSPANRANAIFINPAPFLEAIILEFRRYVALLRNPAVPEHGDARRAFEAAWHLVHRR
jgi:hypothetical protein